MQIVHEEDLSLRSTLSVNSRTTRKVRLNDRDSFFHAHAQYWDNCWQHVYESRSWTPWEFTLHFLYSILLSEKQRILFESSGFANNFLGTVAQMLKSGADITSRITVKNGSECLEMTASDVVSKLLLSLHRDPENSPHFEESTALTLDMLAVRDSEIRAYMRLIDGSIEIESKTLGRAVHGCADDLVAPSESSFVAPSESSRLRRFFGRRFRPKKRI